MMCPCGGMTRYSSHTVKDGTEKEMWICRACGRRMEVHTKDGKEVYRKG